MTSTTTEKLSSNIVAIDPDRAARWLAEHNTRNRNIRKAHVAALARDMESGRWAFNAAPIIFDHDSTLLDGQHRLCAIVRSGATVPMLVVRGVTTDAQHTMDTGARRTAADAYGLDQRGPNAARATAVARFALILDGTAEHEKVTTAEIFDFLEANPLVEACIAATRTQWKAVGLTPRVFDYCYWRLTEIDNAAAYSFFDSLAKLTGLPEGSPITALHRRLIGVVHGTARKQLDAEAQVALVFKAWNAWRSGKSVQKFAGVRRGGGVIDIPTPR